ncbi:hypothetical protein [Chthoniobacter flavus]|uniref:hypothetical protein n=1 Tax=Chthoniobacter flavus TaxID=191863 RepID=UPI0005B2E2BF|nr:hypothetical protein [Chthoniobacter flavus]
MIPTQITESVLALPEADRLELARRIVESVAAEQQVNRSVETGVQRIEEVLSGRIQGLSEEEYIRAVK